MLPLRRLLVSSAAAGLVVLGGCADAPTEPAVLVQAGGLEAALSIAAQLPTFPDLAARALAEARNGGADAGPAGAFGTNGADPVERLRAARELALQAARASDEAEAARLRAEAHAQGLAPLAQLVSEAETERAWSALGFWLGVAEALVEKADLPATREALIDGRMLLDRSRAAAAAGDRPTAVAALVAAGDRLAETTPPAVLRRLLPELEAELAAQVRADTGPPDRRLERAERLLRGAREAKDGGDDLLGLRRAYYARQLLRAAAAPGT